MRRAMVAVGVDRTRSPEFRPLSGAAAGAGAMAKWGEAQGFDIELLTDADGGVVTIAKFFESVARFVDAAVYEQLVVYFSGHGVLHSPDAEVWLLSEAPANPNEAVNVTQSTRLARVCGIPHVVFVSDACRSMPTTFRIGALTPGSVFPGATLPVDSAEVDTFFATLPGDPAYELPPDEAVQRYRALLTQCLLEALQGRPPSLIRRLTTDRATIHVVASRQVKQHLLKAVPAAAGKASIRLSQSPEIRVESALPKYLAEVAAPPEFDQIAPGQSVSRAPRTDELSSPRKAAASASQVELTLSGRLDNRLDLLVRSTRTVVGRQKHSSSREEDGPTVALRRMLASVPDLGDNVETGFAFYGVDVKRAVLQRGRYEARLLSPQHLQLIAAQGQNEERWQHGDAALIRFVDGTGMSLAVLPGYIGVVVAEAGRILTVNYMPSRANQMGWQIYSDRRHEIERSKAIMATLALHGQLRLDRTTARATASELRRYKRVDPTLGLFAAYAYALSSFDGEVLSVYRHMSWDRLPVLFDVAMLASQVTAVAALPQSDVERLKLLDFAPWMPLLSQGWLLLGDVEKSMPPLLQEARRFLLPGLWTRFAPEGIDLLETGIK